MCKIRALRYQCDHVKLRYLSYCRGTYSSPNTKAPLCSAGPSLTVTIEDKCQDCQYAEFCRGWESRIAEAEAKYIATKSLSVERRRSSACAELDSWNGGWGDVGITPNVETDSSDEVETLRRQFREEQWSHWNSYLNSPWAGRRSGANKKRRSSPKSSGDSPLKYVVGTEDLPEPIIENDDLPPLEHSISSDSDVEEISDPGSDADNTDSWTAPEYSWEDLGINSSNWSQAFEQVKEPSENLGGDIADEMLPSY